MQIDAIEQRPRDARLVVAGAARRPAAGEDRIVQIAAAARVHRRDQLEARGVGDMVVGARDGNAADLERLAQQFEHAAVELRN